MDDNIKKVETAGMTCKGCIFNGDEYSNHCARPEELDCMDPEEGKQYIFVFELPVK